MSDPREDAFRGRIIGLLLSPTAVKIDFTLGSVRVETHGLVSVAHALINAAITVQIGGVKPGAGAVYNHKLKRIVVPNDTFDSTILGRGQIMHECIHAMRDIQGSGYYTNIGKPGWPPKNKPPIAIFTESEDEAAGYVTFWLYCLQSDPSMANNVAGPIYERAYDIAKPILNVKGGVVSDDDAMSLREIIAKDPLYSDDGLWSPSIGGLWDFDDHP